MDRRIQLAALLVGVLIGSVATIVLKPAPETERFAVLVKPDMPTVTDISVAEAESLRAGRFENISTIEETLALPTDFAETEALYTIAGRADSGGVQGLIYQAARIQDRTDRQAALFILFLRLTELDPKSALAISRTPSFRSDTRYENEVWTAWGRLNLAAALEEATTGTAAQKNFAAQSLYASARGLENEASALIHEALGIRPGRGAKVQHLYALADLSPVDAIRYVESLPSISEQRQHIGWLGTYLARSANVNSNFAGLIQSSSLRRHFEQTFDMQAAATDPESALKKALALPNSAKSQQHVFAALQQLASQDPTKAMEYLEQMPTTPGAERHQAMVVAVIASSDPDMALAWAREHDTSSGQTMLVGVLSQIAQTDPQLALAEVQSLDRPQSRDRVVSAVAMFVAQSNPEEAIQVLSQISNEQMRSSSSSQIAAAWAQTDFDGALNWVSSLDEKTRRRTLESIGQSFVHSDVDRAIDLLTRFPNQVSSRLTTQIAQNLVQSRSTDEAVSFISRYKDSPEFDQLQSVVIGMTASTDPARAMRMAENVEDQQSRDQIYNTIIGQQAISDPHQALQSLNAISSPEMRASAMSQVAVYWYSSDPAGAAVWIDGLPRGADRDSAIMATISAGRRNGENTQELIATIDDPERRKQATMIRIQTLMYSDRAAAEQLIDETQMTDQEREQVQKMLRSVGSGYRMSID